MFKPFEQGTESVAIHDLTLENDLDRISVYGNLQIHKDQESLEIAKKLQGFFAEIVAKLEQESELPEKIQRPDDDEVENPFY